MSEQRVATRTADPMLVRRLRSQVADRLNQQRRSDEVLGRTPMSTEDERQFARSLIVQVLEDYARGEITVVVAGATSTGATPEDVLPEVVDRVAAGERLKDVCADVAERTGLSKKALYDAAVAARRTDR